MTTLIVITDVMNENFMERDDLEGFENKTFNTIGDLKKSVSGKFEWYTLSDFLTMCNNDEFSIQNVYITYVNIKNYFFTDTYTECGT